MMVCPRPYQPIASSKERDSHTISSGEEWLSTQHLSKDAAHAPDVDRARVLLEGQHNLWSAVPPDQTRYEGSQ